MYFERIASSSDNNDVRTLLAIGSQVIIPPKDMRDSGYYFRLWLFAVLIAVDSYGVGSTDWVEYCD